MSETCYTINTSNANDTSKTTETGQTSETDQTSEKLSKDNAHLMEIYFKKYSSQNSLKAD